MADDFHRLFYDTGAWNRVSWRGVPTQKCPLDLWIYQELIWRLRPATIVEIGLFMGGTTLFLADMLDLCTRAGKGWDAGVVGVDIEPRDRPQHPRIEYVTGDSTDQKVVKAVRDATDAVAGPVMVILDGDHSRAHVAKELDLYAPMVTVGSYLIVEDTNINGHPVLPGWGPGPAEAVAEWLPQHPEFVVDLEPEKLLLTFNPGGFLRRVS